ncbi:MAG: bifunctional aldolase/short-chain dehydrogenase, partial [Desulfobacterales bacterium]|nr:bifunctional aldolase/short-chain dehydrogenase [Desulfobacterales bacterium]
MDNLFNKEDRERFMAERADYPKELAQRVYTSRLIGGVPDLVLHGGGNTSLKLKMKNIVGEENEILFVKGSGKDMASIEPDGFSSLFLAPLKKLRKLPSLTGEEMNNQLKIHRASGDSPNPSVEALLHAFLPHKYIDHTHADSILILTNQARGEEMVKEALGPKVAVLPYTMSGLPLAKAAADLYERNTDVEAMVVMNHGVFTFGEDCKTAYERMIRCVTRAEEYIRDRILDKPLTTPLESLAPIKDPAASAARCAQALRGACACKDAGGRPRRVIVEIRSDPDLVLASQSAEAARICRSGVLTPDHAIRTKNKMALIPSVPENDAELAAVIQEAMDAYKADYLDYVHANAVPGKTPPEESDAKPRLFLVAGLGLFAIGVSRSASRIAADIGERAIRAMLRAFALGEYAPISDAHV